MRKALAVIIAISSFLSVSPALAADPPAAEMAAKIAALTKLTEVQGEAYKAATAEIAMLRKENAKMTAELAITEAELNRARAELWTVQAAARAAATPAPVTTGITDEKAKALLTAQPPGDYMLFAESGVWLARGSISRLRGYSTGLIPQIIRGPRENGADDQWIEYVPVRAVAEALGYRVHWEPKIQNVDMITPSADPSRAKIVFFRVGEPFGFVRGQRTPFTVPDIGVKAFISQENRAMVPLQFLLNNLSWEHGQVSLREQGPGYVILDVTTLG